MPRVILLHGHRVRPEAIRASIHGSKPEERAALADTARRTRPSQKARRRAPAIGMPGGDAAGQHAPGKTLC